MKAGDKSYHPDCFKCEGCSASLASGFFKLDGKIVCNACCNNKTQEVAASKHTCRRCKKPIVGTVIFGDKGDEFHEECFKCEECDCALTEFMIDEGRKFTYQEARYVCPPCYNKNAEEPAIQNRKCLICGEACLPDDKSLHLLDGYSLHWACFKCSSCGKQEEQNGDVSKKTLLRSKVEAAKKGTYSCDECLKKKTTNLGPAPELKISFKAVHGSYVGKLEEKPGHHRYYAIKLMDQGRCSLDCTSATPSSSSAWHAEGTYIESLDDAGRLKAVQFTVTSKPGNEGPETGKIFDFAVEKGDPHDILVCEGIKCSLHVGVPDYEIAQMMKAPARTSAPKPVAAANSEEVPEGCYSLADLTDADVWKTKNIEAGSRETYLSDASFLTVFGMSKSEFAAQPKWKRDKAKKEHGLF